MTAEHNIDHIRILKTNINTSEELERIKLILDLHEEISEWSVDMEDIDKVLRITAAGMSEQEIIFLMMNHGISCSELN